MTQCIMYRFYRAVQGILNALQNGTVEAGSRTYAESATFCATHCLDILESKEKGKHLLSKDQRVTLNFLL